MRPIHRSSAVVFVIVLAAFSGACGDALPTETRADDQPVRFTLSDEDAVAFAGALADVSNRILPSLGTADAAHSITPLLDELTSALALRDQRLLRLALVRIDDTLMKLGRDQDEAVAISSELDAVRLILEHARPLAAGGTGTTTR